MTTAQNLKFVVEACRLDGYDIGRIDYSIMTFVVEALRLEGYDNVKS